MNEIAAILLAAGRSSRMGAFKPLLKFGNTTVIESSIEKLKLGGAGQVVVVVGHRAADIERQLDGANISCVLNPDPDSEMNISIARGIRALDPSAKATLIALGDQPAIPPSVVRTLIEHWEQGAKVVKPEFEGRGGHPVLIDLCFREELLKLDHGSGLKGFFTAHGSEVRRVTVNSEFIARDLDTWDDYVTLHREVFGFSPDTEAERPN